MITKFLFQVLASNNTNKAGVKITNVGFTYRRW